jgi:hypothetical protein
MPLSVKAGIAIRQHRGIRRGVKRRMRKSRSGEMQNGFFKNCLIVLKRASTGKLPVINGSDFPNGDAPSLCGTRDDGDIPRRRPNRLRRMMRLRERGQ